MSKTIKGIIYQYEDGGTYCGEWEKDSAEGYGCGTGPKGQGRFEGCWKNGNQVSGVYTWPQGMKYMGQWKENQRDGLGRETREDGSEYCGEFTRGARGTYGVIKLPNGTYRGSWRNGKQDGEGEEMYTDGGCYRGQYKNGVRSGFGTRASAAYELNEKDSKTGSKSLPPATIKKVSISSVTSTDSSHSSSSDALISGSNPETLAQIYEGEWKNDRRHGHGVLKCINSYTYYGQWESNSRTGYGVLVYENGSKEEGQWQCGQLIVALKRRKINFKSHQLESKVQAAYTQAIQAADAARNKAVLAESRATSATAKFKQAKVVSLKAEKDALLAREKAELYKNAPRISENMKSPMQDPTVTPTHFFQTREPSGEGSNYMKYLGLDSGGNGANSACGMSQSTSFEAINSLSRPVSAPINESGSDSDPENLTEYHIVRQSSGRSSSGSARSSVDYQSLKRHNKATFYVKESGEPSEDSLFGRRSSEGSGKDRERLVRVIKGDQDRVLEEADEDGYDIDDVDFDLRWGGRREGTMARYRKRDKTTGELEQSSDEDTSEERAAKAKMMLGEAKSISEKPYETTHSVAVNALVENLNQMATWNKMIAYVNFFLLVFLMILILVVIGSMYYYQLVSYYHNHQGTEAQGPTSFISPIA